MRLVERRVGRDVRIGAGRLCRRTAASRSIEGVLSQHCARYRRDQRFPPPARRQNGRAVSRSSASPTAEKIQVRSRAWPATQLSTAGFGAWADQFGDHVGVQQHGHGRGFSRKTAARVRARAGGNSRSTPLSGSEIRAREWRARDSANPCIAPHRIAQDQPRFLFHGAPVVFGGADAQAGLHVVIEVADRDARHGPVFLSRKDFILSTIAMQSRCGNAKRRPPHHRSPPARVLRSADSCRRTAADSVVTDYVPVAGIRIAVATTAACRCLCCFRGHGYGEPGRERGDGYSRKIRANRPSPSVEGARRDADSSGPALRPGATDKIRSPAFGALRHRAELFFIALGWHAVPGGA